MKKLLIALTGLMVMGGAAAKLPALSDEAKAKAAETKNKADWSNKVASYQLCQSQDKVAAGYLKSKGKAKPATEVPPCVNPGAYVALPPAAAVVAPATPAAAASVAPAAAPAVAPAVAKPAPAAAPAAVKK
jgi:hypothetical protein